MMQNQSVKQLFSILHGNINRSTHFLGLSISIMALNVFAYTLASSLFIIHAGSQGLPLSYIAIGLASVPLYTGFSQVADRYSHSRTFIYLLLGGILLIAFFQYAIQYESLLVYYAIYIGFYFQWRLHLDILLPSTISDYFTSREYSHLVAYLTMAQSIGGLVGGALVGVLADRLSTGNLLLILPFLYSLVIVQIWYLERSEEPIEGSRLRARSNHSSIENLKVLPLLRKRYPIIDFLIASSILWVILYSLAEFEYLSIYSEAFMEERELTRFLGLFRAASEVLQLLLLYFVTRPGIRHLGVVGMNPIYPITTLIGFISLGLWGNLPVAIGLNLNNAAVETALNQPVHTLNFNAIPSNFVGRVRSLVDGLFYSLGLAFVGALLWVFDVWLADSKTVLLATVLATLFVLVRHGVGRSYLQSLLSMLRAGSVRLNDVSEGLDRLPDNYTPQIRQLLRSKERDDRLLGLQLASRIDRPSRFITEIECLPLEEDTKLRLSAIDLLSTAKEIGISEYLRELLQSQRTKSHSIARREALQAIALSSLLANRQLLSDKELRPLLNAKSEELHLLACVAAENAKSSDPVLNQACEQLWRSEKDEETQRILIRGISSTGNKNLIPRLNQILTYATAEATKEALNGLAALAPKGNEDLAELAIAELDRPDPAVRMAAIDLLGAIQSPKFLPVLICRGLEDLDFSVRLQSALAIANYGEASLSLLETYLDSPRPEIVEAAIAAIAKVRTRRAEKILFNHLKPSYEEVACIVRWRQQIPHYNADWWALDIALQDYSKRLIQRVLYVLSRLGHQRTLNHVRQMLDATDARRRANAVEALASLKHRRFVIPILPLLELPEGNLSPTKGVRRRVLQEVFQASDRWIRLGAAIVLATRGRFRMLEKQMERESDPLVRQVADRVLQNSGTGFDLDSLPIGRVLFLKTTPLFGGLSLDELFPIARAFKLEKFRADREICEEGKLGNTLYVVYQGNVRVSQNASDGKKKLGRLERGDSFGDSGLFDDVSYQTTIEADSDCSLLALSRDSFYILIDLYPKLLSCFGQVGAEV
ncbi:MAG: HEAT repeat domain-containing protein [Cyanobacteriota bacterium]|nr:HEAT repeat domain-containing protein [Cyanobacteriota bacterium]